MDKSLEDFLQEHLPYEIEMMRFAIQALDTPKLDRLKKNAFIETFCLHARNLIEFFKDKDACAFDPRDFTVSNFELNKRFIGDSALTEINRQVSHLTKGRTRDEKEKINGEDIAKWFRDIEAEIDRFLQHLTRDSQAVWNAGKGPQSRQKFKEIALAHVTTTTSALESYTLYIGAGKNRPEY